METLQGCNQNLFNIDPRSIVVGIAEAGNTHLLRKGKNHCTVDLLFDWFGFNQTSKYVTNSA